MRRLGRGDLRGPRAVTGMDNGNNARREEQEIIEQREVQSKRPQRIKIKIKERVARRERKRMPLFYKMIALLIASFLGFAFGAKIVNRYVHYWKKPYVKYRDTKESKSVRDELVAGQVFSLDQR